MERILFCRDCCRLVLSRDDRGVAEAHVERTRHALASHITSMRVSPIPGMHVPNSDMHVPRRSVHQRLWTHGTHEEADQAGDENGEREYPRGNPLSLSYAYKVPSTGHG